MMTTKNYEFCEDIWTEIKSYIFVPRTRGDKCDCCDKKWTRRFAVRETDIWWEGKQVCEPREWSNRLTADGKVWSYSIPIPYGDYPAEVKVGVQNEVKLNHYCDECWVENTIGWKSGRLSDFTKQLFSNRFLNVVGKTDKNEKLVNKILFTEQNWLIKKHRLIETRQLQATAIQILEAMIKDFNKIQKQEITRREKEYKEKLEDAKVVACQRFYTKMSIERVNRDLLKKFEKGEIKYPEFVKKFKK